MIVPVTEIQTNADSGLKDFAADCRDSHRVGDRLNVFFPVYWRE